VAAGPHATDPQGRERRGPAQPRLVSAIVGRKTKTGLGAILATVAFSALAMPAEAPASPLQVGVGRADITPPTGYYMMGWVRSDGIVTGQHTRLWARVIVLKKGGRKVALVSEDLNGIPGGMMATAARRDRDIGFSQRNVLDSASHTHAAPTGFYNFATYNTVFMTINSPTDFQLTGGLDPQLYAFMVRRLARAIRRANANLGPGRLGWGFTTIDDLTKNRSIEAHLYDHGIHEAYGTGSPAQDPKGPIHTIDPQVNVLRVDKTIGGRSVPVGMWSTFADHGTVNKFQFTYYNEDHHGAATKSVERAIRRAGDVPDRQQVVDVYGNTDEGDMSAGLDRSGPAAAERVGKREAKAFLLAWRKAGGQMSDSPELDWRWTRMCFCGQDTAEGPVADKARFGVAEFTGSEEGRGPLFDVTRVPFEGDHLPAGSGTQGDKIEAPIDLDVPTAVPLMALRLGDRMVVSIPGEMTEGMGRRVRAAVFDASTGSGVRRAVISGLANEYADYFTTPEEYDAQHYEGAATVYGRASSVALKEALVGLTHRLVLHQPSVQAYPYDPRNGVSAKAAPFGLGARHGHATAQPRPRARRLLHPFFSWQGGERGLDRPLDRAFVRVQRRTAHGWRTAATDLGLDILWTVDDNGVYRAEWEPPLNAAPGRYRFAIRANRYRLVSHSFRLLVSRALRPRRVSAPAGRVAVVLDYPRARVHESIDDKPPDAGAGLTYRPRHSGRGRVTFLVDGRPVTVTAESDGRFEVPAAAGARVVIRAGTARDRYGNTNRAALAFDA
jgi:neutral ceramidase